MFKEPEILKKYLIQKCAHCANITYISKFPKDYQGVKPPSIFSPLMTTIITILLTMMCTRALLAIF